MMETDINMEVVVPRYHPTVVLQDVIDVDRRLAELGFGTRDDIQRIRDVACARAAEGASPFFPLNGPGTLAFQYGTRELRAHLHGLGWKLDDSFGTSGMQHADEPRLAFYQNVDVACDLPHDPRPRTRKGAGAERLDQDVLFDPEGIPTAFDSEAAGREVWYVMVAENGAVEVTNAVVRKGWFAEIRERLFVEDGDGFDVVDPAGDLPADDAVDFDVPVLRR